MRLSSLLATLPPELAPTEWLRDDPSTDPIIRGITYDSRRVSPGDLYIALSGAVSDGHDYLEQAFSLGAAAALVERAPSLAKIGDRAAVVVPDSRRAMAPIAMRFFGEPASELQLVGVTGTNGKTSTTYLIESILTQAHKRTGLIGTVEIRYANERISAVNTTPESLDLQRTLRSMCTQNIEAVAMEVSSHGLELGRVNGCRFSVVAFTNLTQDHLDFHGDMDTYRDSKVMLFRDYVAPGGHAVVNVDDPAAEHFIAAARERGAQVLRCSRSADAVAEVRLTESDVTLTGSRARLELPQGSVEVELPLIGDFNLENLVVSVGVALALGVSPDRIVAGVAACPQVPGRMEVVDIEGASGLPTVIVDYAHTPDAVEKLLAAVRPLCRERVIAVFGCGGDRDRAKRPLMAEAVARNADLAIATSDNPRTEDPDRILEDVVEGLSTLKRVEPDALGDSAGAYALIRDRRQAIRCAIALAKPGDTVVLAGKGHEDYQIVGAQKLPFDDREEARKALLGTNEALEDGG
jgi:UDP-N-acetylmuramoyl-L-alanyl-D-glutamate--2,6-diaminopimelate ligase